LKGLEDYDPDLLMAQDALPVDELDPLDAPISSDLDYETELDPNMYSGSVRNLMQGTVFLVVSAVI